LATNESQDSTAGRGESCRSSEIIPCISCRSLGQDERDGHVTGHSSDGSALGLAWGRESGETSLVESVCVWKAALALVQGRLTLSSSSAMWSGTMIGKFSRTWQGGWGPCRGAWLSMEREIGFPRSCRLSYFPPLFSYARMSRLVASQQSRYVEDR
jgi:hypothetical protein